MNLSIWQFVVLVQYVGSGSSWPQRMLYGLIFLRRDGEKIMLLFMLLWVQNHGKMYMRCKIVVIELECKFFNLVYRVSKSMHMVTQTIHVMFHLVNAMTMMVRGAFAFSLHNHPHALFIYWDDMNWTANNLCFEKWTRLASLIRKSMNRSRCLVQLNHKIDLEENRSKNQETSRKLAKNWFIADQ